MRFPPWIASLFNGARDAVAIEVPEDPPLRAIIPSDVAWNKFLVSKRMNTILTARHARHLPSSPAIWADLCQTACKLWIQLDNDGLIDYLPTVYPTLCLVIKGNYYFQTYPTEARQLMFDEDPYTNLVRSVAACSFCPYSFARRLLETQTHQLMIADYVGRQTPLHVLCDQEEIHRDPNSESLVALFVESCATVTSEMDSEGLYPLHRACKASYTWSTGIEILVKAAPQIVLLEYRGQTPFMLVALAHARKKDGARRSPSSSCSSHQPAMAQYDTEVTETLFEMLRLDPNVVKHLHGREVVGHSS